MSEWDAIFWNALLDESRKDRARRVAALPFAVSLDIRAKDYGIAPHAEATNCPACPRFSRENADAASLIRWARQWDATAPGRTAIDIVKSSR